MLKHQQYVHVSGIGLTRANHLSTECAARPRIAERMTAPTAKDKALAIAERLVALSSQFAWKTAM